MDRLEEYRVKRDLALRLLSEIAPKQPANNAEMLHLLSVIEIMLGAALICIQDADQRAEVLEQFAQRVLLRVETVARMQANEPVGRA